jgi:hypothetical protein
MAVNKSMRIHSDGPEELEVSDKKSSDIPFGLFEVDATGRVIHYSPPHGEKIDGLMNNVVGLNFFNDLIPLTQVKDLKKRFLSFMSDGHSVERFSINIPLLESSIKVQIVMVSLIERSENGRERFALIRLMPDTQSRPALHLFEG